MSQKKVTEYFLARKVGGARQPSKRQKITNAEVTTSTEAKVRVQSIDSSSTVAALHCSKPTRVSSKKTKTPRKQTIATSLSKLKPVIPPSVLRLNSTQDDSQENTVCEIATAISDSTPASSPSKRSSSSGLSQSLKRGRVGTAVSQTPEAFNFTPYTAEPGGSGTSEHSPSPRRKLVLQKQQKQTGGKESAVFCFTGSESANGRANVSPTTEAKVITITGVTNPEEPGKGSSTDSNGNKTLGKCKNLAELKKKLTQFQVKQSAASNSLERARHASVNKQDDAKPEISVDTSSKQQSSSDVINENCTAKIPAYQRHSALASKDPATFQLPYHYRLLGDTFQSTDTIVSMLHNRNEICTFAKLKGAVQEMTKRLFELSHLGQIKTIYPTAYCFLQEKDLPMFGGKSSNYQLTISANLNDSGAVNNGSGEIRHTFTATKLLERKHTFLQNLINIVKQYHQAFLKKLNINVQDGELKRWHPRFELEKVPHIVPAELPQSPTIKKFSSAQDVLDEVKDRLNPRIQKALEVVASKGAQPIQATASAAGTLPSPPPAAVSTPPAASKAVLADRLNAFKGIPQALLDRVRAKQAEKQEREMLRSTDDNKKIEMLQRLPELTRILRVHFISQKRPAIPVADVVKSFSDSYKSALSTVEAENHLKLMAEVVPDWMMIVHLKSGSFVKVNRDIDLTRVHHTINAYMKAI